MIFNNRKEIIRIRKLFLFVLLSILSSTILFSHSGMCFAETPQEPLLHRSIQKAMERISEGTNKKTAAGFCASLIVLGREKEFETGQVLALSLIGSSAITAALKYFVNRKRPTPPNERKNSSFPSGHATAAFAAATIVSDSYPRLTVPVYIAAGSVAYSRLYLRRHYATDIVGGALIGIFTSKLLIKYKSHITFHGKGLMGLFFSRDTASICLTF